MAGLFLFCCYLKIKDVLQKTTYQNINTANVGRVVVFSQVCCNICIDLKSQNKLLRSMNIWQKICLFQSKQKVWGGKKFSKSVFGYFKTKKSLGVGEGLGLNGPSITNFFFAACPSSMGNNNFSVENMKNETKNQTFSLFQPAPNKMQPPPPPRPLPRKSAPFYTLSFMAYHRKGRHTLKKWFLQWSDH